MTTTLVIMAAGIGSRFGTGIKQLAPVGKHSEIIMDYSIHDAIEAGFDRIIFIIRRDIEEAFRKIIGGRIEDVCTKLGVEVRYAFQSLTDLPEGAELPEGRRKPWGTGQAVLACKDLIDGPFAVVNADDYYGKDALRKVYDFLSVNKDESAYCMPGFIMKNTLSEHGGVTRGVCDVSPEGFLLDVIETKNIVKTVSEDGTVGAVSGDVKLDVNACVSMNMWGLSPEFIKILEEGFKEFLEYDVPENPLKAEYLLPIIIAKLLCENRITVKVLETGDKWFGVTYKEDLPNVIASFSKLIEDGVYRDRLFDDLLEKADA